MKHNILIVGATGVVGRTVIKILNEKKFKNCNYNLFATKKSKGLTFNICGQRYVVDELTEEIFKKHYDYALFCTNEEIAKTYIKKLTKNKTVVIDFSSFFRKKCPLVVPEINADKIKNKKIICNPNCSTIASVMSLYKIHQMFGLKRVIFSTYQAVSGAGQKALEDMKTTKQEKLKKLNYVINNNLIPCIGDIKDNLYSKEENKMIYETKKILNDNNIKVTATCVRVPIKICHSISINFETIKRTNIQKIKEVLNNTKGVKVVDTYIKYPMPINVEGKNDVYVGRIRKDYSKPNCFNIFVVSDNLRKGAAQNGVQILEELLKESI